MPWPGVRAGLSRQSPVPTPGPVLHFISDDEDPYATIRTLTGAMPPGSYLVISHITPDDVGPDAGRKAQEVYGNATAQVTGVHA